MSKQQIKDELYAIEEESQEILDLSDGADNFAAEGAGAENAAAAVVIDQPSPKSIIMGNPTQKTHTNSREASCKKN